MLASRRENIFERFQRLAENQPQQLALRFLSDGEQIDTQYNYAQIDEYAQSVGGYLQAFVKPGDRVLLLLPSGPDYVIAFLGCLYAGVIAVPAYPPERLRPQYNLRLQAIAADCRPALVLTQREWAEAVVEQMVSLFDSIKSKIVLFEEIDFTAARVWRPPLLHHDSIAFLQYTSGSTADPKGVMVGFDNLLANETAIQQRFGITEADSFVSWLPLFHDMGLVGGLMQPLYSGIALTLMSPKHFLERPVRWLEAITRYGGSISGGPNFAFRLCVERIGNNVLDSLDLSSWRIAFCGAEPIRQETLTGFAEKFAPAGLNPNALYPCYGLAESTLLVTGGRPGSGASVANINADARAAGRFEPDAAGQAIVNCGAVQDGHMLALMHPQSCEPVSEGAIGEVWVSGPSVAQGYWQNAADTAAVFVSRNGKSWLRTGDLAFMQNGALFITGRLKDLILIRGHNLYPQDLEILLEEEIEVLRKGRIAAFAVTHRDGEGIGIAAEIGRSTQKLVPPQGLFGLINETLALAYQEPASVILLLQPGTLPKTTSGKLQRRACWYDWQNGELQPYAVYQTDQAPATEAVAVQWSETEQQIAVLFQEILHVAVTDRNASFFALGGNSIDAMHLLALVRERFAIELESSAIFEAPAIAAFAARLDNTRRMSDSVLPVIVRHRDTENKLPSEFPVSYAQQRIWFHHQIAPENTAFHMTGAVRVQGKLLRDVLEQTLIRLAQRHESLRTVFVESSGTPKQRILAEPVTDLNWVPCTSNEGRAENLRSSAVANALRPFELGAGSLWRLLVIERDQDAYELYLVMHHIIADGWSVNVLLNELAGIYTALARGNQPELPELPLRYVDYAIWQRDRIEGGELASQQAYWLEQLGGAQSLIQLPLDYSRSATRNGRGDVVRFSLSPEINTGFNKILRAEGATVFTGLLTAFAALLFRYCGQPDMRVGIPVSNRGQVATTGIIGLFVNMLVVRTRINGSLNFYELLRQVRATVLAAQDHAEMPFDQLVEALHPERELGISPLFQVLYNHLQIDYAALEKTTDWKIERIDWGGGGSQFDLSLETEEDPDGTIRGVFVYATDLFDRATIERMAGHFQAILAYWMHDPAQRLSALQLEQPDPVPYADESESEHFTPVIARISQLALQQPDRVALIDSQRQITYAAMERQANRIARRLIQIDAGAEHCIGLLAKRGADLVTGALGILKAGAAYVPLDADYPPERLQYILEDAHISVVLLQKSLEAEISLPASMRRIYFESLANADDPIDPPTVTVTPHQLAYVIYTSGTTGYPKGVSVTHGPLAMHCRAVAGSYGLQQADCALHGANFTFDAAVEQWLVPLLAGARLLIGDTGLWGVEEMAAAIRTHGVTLIYPPSAPILQLADWAAGNSTKLPIRLCTVGGEAVSRDAVARIHQGLQPDLLINGYGPTEAIITPLLWTMPADKPCVTPYAPIGRAVGERAAYVLDSDLNIVPSGVEGELYIGGSGLARGYYQRPALTAECFIPDPFGLPGSRMYRTRDRARRLASSDIEFLGRSDRQIKLRGYRIELGEIEAQLLALPNIGEACVTLHRGTGTARLVAYVTADGDHDGITAYAKKTLEQRLPGYMVPSAILAVDQLPRTAHGKIDYAALPDPQPERKDRIMPQTKLEHRLAEIWRALLKIEDIGITDNFFELGGDSIIALQVVSRARSAGITLTPAALFRHQTIETLAESIAFPDGLQPAKMMEPEDGEVRLTPVQADFFSQNIPNRHHWNQSLLLNLRQDVDISSMEAALAALVTHHDAFRLRYSKGPEGWCQWYVPHRKAADQKILWAHEISRQLELEQLCAAAQKSLDLEHGPLMRAVLVTHPDKRQSLLLVIHHLVVDGVSWRILLEDLEMACRQHTSGVALQLPAVMHSFRRHASALCQLADDAMLAEQVDYWRAITSGAMTGFPPDAPDAAACVRDAAEVVLRIDGKRTRMLLDDALSATRMRVDELLLAALARTAAAGRGDEAIIVELESHGRNALPGQAEDVDLSRTVGWFTAIYPVRLTLSDDLDDCIRHVKQAVRNVPHEGLGYGVLQHYAPLALQKQTACWQRSAVTFNYLGRLDNSFGNENGLFEWNEAFSGQDRDAGAPLTNILEINAYVHRGELVLNWRYSRAQYREETIRSLVAAYRANLEEIIGHCLDQERSGVTPADFPLVQLRQDDLDTLGQSMREVEDIYPLTALQQGILYHSLESPAADAYFYQRGFLLCGSLSVTHFQRAWETVANQHVALRSNYCWEGLSVPVQVVCRSASVRLIEADWRGVDEPGQWSRLDTLLQDERQQGFDFAGAAALRLRLIRVADETWWFIWSQHHIVLDGWSMGIVLRDVMQAYRAYLHERPWRCAALYTYSDYLHWLAKRDRAQALNYWKQQLTGFEVSTPIPGGRWQESPGYAELSCSLDAVTTRRIQEAAQRQGVTLNTLVQGVWALILGRYSGHNDVMFGITVSGRSAAVPGIEEWVGLLINTLPLRVRLSGDETVTAWLQRLQRQNVELQAYEDVPLNEIQRVSEMREGNSLFESILVFENYPLDEILLKQSDELAIRLLEPNHCYDKDSQPGRNNFPLSLIASLHHGRLTLAFSWRRDRVDGKVIRALAAHVPSLIEQLAAGSALRLGDLSLRGERENEQFRGEPHVREPQSVLAAWSHWVAERPDDIAIQYEDSRWSYAALDQAANRLARMLLSLGVTADDRIGLLLSDRSAEWVLSILAVFKAGAAYLPFSCDMPGERVRQLLSDAGVSRIITDQRNAEEMKHSGFTVIHLDDPEIARYAPEPVIPHVSPDHLAYVIYTSGSTGRPKGVAISHRALSHYVDGVLQRLALSPASSMAMISTPMADLGNTVLFGALVSGSLLHLVSAERAANPAALGRYMQENNVSILKIVPGHLQGLLEAVQDGSVLPSEMLVLGGEAADPALIRRVTELQPQCRIVNHYGPAETCVGVLTHELNDEIGDTIPIGHPLPGVRAYVLDAELNPLPEGIPGELYIGGAGLARGYHDNPAETADRFIPDLFGCGERLYRSGDRVVHRAGLIEFLGRCDDQIKLRGYRIEPNEIAQQLRMLSGVRDCVVLPQWADNGSVVQLLGYYVPDDMAQHSVDTVRAALAARLPDYMVPVLVTLDAIPRTLNGKIDRQALPRPDKSPDKTYRAPRNEMERLLCDIWREALVVDEVGIDDHFVSLGGDSILSLKVIARARRQEIKLTPRLMFEYPTIEQLASRLMSDNQPETVSCARIVRDESVIRAPLSHSQERLWFLSQLTPENTAYHILGGLRFAGNLNIDALNSALSALVARHESLRTSLHEEAGKAYQIIHPAYELTADVVDISQLPDRALIASNLNQVSAQEAQQSFILEQGRPLRATLVQCAAGEFVLLISFHHVAVDGWSMNCLMAELAECYSAVVEDRMPELPSLPIRFIDYVQWQRSYLASTEGEKQLAYWMSQLKGDISSSLALPADHPRTVADGFHGAVYTFEFDAKLADQLRTWAQQEKTTLFIIILAVFQILLSRISGQSVLHIGTPVANRDHPETQGVVGFFVNTLVHRGEVRGDLTVQSLLAAVQKTVLGAQTHQNLPFERLVEALQPERHLDRHPLFQVLYNHQKRDFAPLKQLPGLVIERYPRAAANTQFELALHTEEDEEGILKGTWAYAKERFNEDTIARWHGCLVTLLRQLAHNAVSYDVNSTFMVGNLSLLEITEAQRVLQDWNKTTADYGRGACIHRLFEAQVEKTPAAIALIFPQQGHEQRLTYAELNIRANQLAHRLRSLGVGPDVLVGIAVERSIEMVVGLLGILKAGGAYVPLDPGYPAERLNYMMTDSAISLLLTQEQLHTDLSVPDNVRILLLDEQSENDWSDESGENLPLTTQPGNLAYVIYTSGSTGEPKGTLLAHRNVSRLMQATEQWFHFDDQDVWSLFHSYAFDFSVWEIFGALLYGGKLVIVPHEVTRSTEDFYNLLCDSRVTVLNQTPSAFRQLMDTACAKSVNGLALRHVIFGGEALAVESLQPWFDRFGDTSPQLTNMYGITETTVHVTYRPLSNEDKQGSPLGRTIDDLSWYILDCEQQPVVPGCIGELYVGGAGLARGYLNRPGLTAERFVPNPFGKKGSRLYRTGDLARYRSDGSIEYAGRIDHQVKIRGFRIELGEIESQMLRQPEIKEAVIVDQYDSTGARLIGYVVAQPDQIIDSTGLRKRLAESLPEYMVPSVIVAVEALPLTPNGKLDRKALPDPGFGSEKGYEAPQNQIEEKLAQIWSEILLIDRVGRNDNFFDLGGHSLIAMQLVAKLRDELQMTVPVRLIFEQPELRQMAAEIASASAMNGTDGNNLDTIDALLRKMESS